jgi:hypothetical protein
MSVPTPPASLLTTKSVIAVILPIIEQELTAAVSAAMDAGGPVTAAVASVLVSMVPELIQALSASQNTPAAQSALAQSLSNLDYPVPISGSLLRRIADREIDFKLGELSAGYESIKQQIGRNEEEAQRQWDLLHEEILGLGKSLNSRLEKLEDAYKKVVTWMAGISAAITVAVWFVEHVVLK